MKKIIVITSAFILTIALSAFTISNWKVFKTETPSCQAVHEMEPPTFVYSLNAGSKNTISKATLQKAKTVADLMPDHGMKEDLRNKITALKNLKILLAEKEVHLLSSDNNTENNIQLSAAQMDVLKTAEYASNFMLEGVSFYTKGEQQDRVFSYFMKIVPEDQASYGNGNKALIDHLESKCQPLINELKRGHLKSGNIEFTITKDGDLTDITLLSTCGYSSIDQRMLDTLKDLPGSWNAAMNAKNETVDQTLIFSFGQDGC